MTKTSEYPGVVRTPDGRWMARITLTGKRIYLGRFLDELAACRAINTFWLDWIRIEDARRSEEVDNATAD